MSKFEKFYILGEIWAFMRTNKKWWLGPIIILMLLMGLLVVLTQSSVFAPLIYTIF